jgi:NAD(P)-dependent dehydrogenase (short-subunit alcohol dehydrogenase family)
MLERGSGSIVNIASVAGLLGFADRAAYNASKHGLIGLTRTLAAEWGGRGVRVNAVCPGWVKTEMDSSTPARRASSVIPKGKSRLTPRDRHPSSTTTATSTSRSSPGSFTLQTKHS